MSAGSTPFRSEPVCPHRIAVGPASVGAACCGIVRQLVGADAADCQVAAEACRFCSRCPAPSVYRLNEVVASLVCQTSVEAEAKPGGADRVVRLAETRAWATRFLPVVQGSNHSARGRDPTAQVTSSASWHTVNRRRRPRLGLVGPDNHKGLGSLNRDLTRWLPIERWLVPGDGNAAHWTSTNGSCRVRYLAGGGEHRRHLANWLRGLDAVLFAESPWFDGLTELARRLQVRVVCVPNWEWIHPGLDWLDDVDVMICPTRFTKQILDGWKQRFGYRWTTRYHPWPIDTQHFVFRQRSICRRFVFVNGTGGVSPRLADGTPATFRRKGLELLAEAARRLPGIPFLVWTQTGALPLLPPNVELRAATADNRRLYEEGDVCVQPSHWEGIGLPLLECQAAGLPLVTTDAPPMNEHQPWAAIPVTKMEAWYLSGSRAIPVPRPAVEELAALLESLFGSDVSEPSRAARAFVEQTHDWRRTKQSLLESIGS